MAIERAFANLTKEQSEILAAVFEADGASATVTEEEGAFRIKVRYTDPWELEPSVSVTSDTMPSPAQSGWSALLCTYAADADYTGAMKAASVAQWILESGRGTSDLAKDHRNYASLKFRERMKHFAQPTDYKASDGVDVYCKFASEKDFIAGYWHFIDSGPYDGYKKFENDAAGYIRHIAPNYAGDVKYIDKVLPLLAEATALLKSATTDSEPATVEGLTAEKKLAVVVGHNKKAPGASSVSPINLSEFDFNNQVAAAMEEEGAHYNLVVKRFNREPNTSYTAEIAEVYERVKQWGADVAIELHFNSLNSSSTGTEVLHAAGSSKSQALSAKLVAAMGELLGLKIRHGNGLVACQKGDRGYSSLVAIEAPTALVEPFFGSNPNDCLAAAKVGTGALGRAYLRGVRDWISA